MARVRFRLGVKASPCGQQGSPPRRPEEPEQQLSSSSAAAAFSGGQGSARRAFQRNHPYPTANGHNSCPPLTAHSVPASAQPRSPHSNTDNETLLTRTQRRPVGLEPVGRRQLGASGSHRDRADGPTDVQWPAAEPGGQRPHQRPRHRPRQRPRQPCAPSRSGSVKY